MFLRNLLKYKQILIVKEISGVNIKITTGGGRDAGLARIISVHIRMSLQRLSLFFKPKQK